MLFSVIVVISNNKMNTDFITIYTDGSSRGNPGPGGFGTILMYGNHRKEISAGYRLTTNNRMELMGVLEGLKALKRHDIPVTIFTDSQYIVNAINKGWLNTWIKTNFKGGKKNRDLWEEISSPFNAATFWLNS